MADLITPLKDLHAASSDCFEVRPGKRYPNFLVQSYAVFQQGMTANGELDGGSYRTVACVYKNLENADDAALFVNAGLMYKLLAKIAKSPLSIVKNVDVIDELLQKIHNDAEVLLDGGIIHGEV